MGITGATLPDFSGNRDSGTITTATWANGGLYFPGTNGNAITFSEVEYAAGSQVTFVIDLMLAANGTYHTMFNKRNSLTTHTYQFRLGGASGDREMYLSIRRASSNTVFDSNAAVPVGQRCVIAMVFEFPASGDAGTCTFYLNGVAYTVSGSSAVTGDYVDPNTPEMFGDNYTAGMPFNGTLYSASRYNRLLTPAQVLALTADPLCWLRRKTMISLYVPSGGPSGPAHNIFNSPIFGKKLVG